MKNKIIQVINICFVLTSLSAHGAQPNNTKDFFNDNTKIAIALISLGRASWAVYRGEQLTTFGATTFVVAPIVLLSCIGNKKLRCKKNNASITQENVPNVPINNSTGIRAIQPNPIILQREREIAVAMLQRQEAEQTQQRETRIARDTQIAQEEKRIEELRKQRMVTGKPKKKNKNIAVAPKLG